MKEKATFKNTCKWLSKLVLIFALLSLCMNFLSMPVAAQSEVLSSWHTFLKGADSGQYSGIVVDSDGNIYVCGYSHEEWGEPIQSYTSGMDAYAVKLDPNGNLIWNTFWGQSGHDWAYDLAIDNENYVYITGICGGHAFARKLDINGNLIWHTSLGWGQTDWGYSIDVDINNNVYLCGTTRNFEGDRGFVVKLNDLGNMIWNSFLGGNENSHCHGITLDGAGNIYVAGRCYDTWGSPSRAYTQGEDGFIAKLSNSGNLTWNTFLGGTGSDRCRGITLDDNGYAYVCGWSGEQWDTPVFTTSLYPDGLVAKLNVNDGNLIWHTFLGDFGSSGLVEGKRIIVDSFNNIYITGWSGGTWGTPVHQFTNSPDCFVTKLNNDGSVNWNTFLGGEGSDKAEGIALDSSGNIYVCGYSNASWGSPINSYTANYDAFVVKLNNSGILNFSDLVVEGNGLVIHNGSQTPSINNGTSFGGTKVAGETLDQTFVIKNIGDGPLYLTGTPIITLNGLDADDFTVVVEPTSPIPVGNQTTFTIQFHPSDAGVRTAIVNINNHVSKKDPYVFEINGIGIKDITVGGIHANDKVYDGNSFTEIDVNGAYLIGLNPDHDVALVKDNVTGVFSDENVGIDKIVNLSGFTLAGTNIEYYTLTQPTTTADITAKGLTVTGITASNKVYDGTTGATIDTSSALLVGVIEGDDVTLDKSAATGNFTNADIGIGKIVNISGLTINGTDALNYNLAQPVTTANIQAPPPPALPVTRSLPAVVIKGQTLEVTVTFTVLSDSFNSFGISDSVPEGWVITADKNWCSPLAADVIIQDNHVEYIWLETLLAGDQASAMYQVTVPEDAIPGSYDFHGFVEYYSADVGPFTSNVTGITTIEVVDGIIVTGYTYEANGNILPDVTLSINGSTPVTSTTEGIYELIALTTGTYTVTAYKDGYRNIERTVTITDITIAYSLDFIGNYGLIPNVPNMSYVLACINKWKYRPAGLGLDISKILSVINAWKYPIE